MSTRLIVIANSKGGVGKTLTTMCLSAELAQRGNRVLVVDCDEQASSSAWAGAASDNAQFPATVINLAAHKEKVHREIQRHLAHYDFIVIDTPPALSSIASSALLTADMAIIPLPPAPADIWAAHAVKSLVQRAKEVNLDLKAVILANKVGRTTLSAAAMLELEDFGIPLMRTRLSTRVAYQQAALAGASVTALGRAASAASLEVKALTDEVLEILGDTK